MVQKVVAVNVAILLALAVIAELLFGNWIFGPHYGTMNIPRNSNRHFDTTNLYAGGGKTKYSRDEHGLRGPYDDLSQVDVLTLGGSTTNQLYLDDNDTWQAEMRRLFLAAGNPKTIVDASVDGQSTRGHIAVFDRWFPNVPDIKSRYVLAYVGINDVAVDDTAQWDQMESPEASRRFRYWIMNQSALYGLYRTIRGIIRSYDAKLIHESAPAPTPDRTEWQKYGPAAAAVPFLSSRERDLAAYEKRLMALVGKIRSFGARAILVTQPTAEFRIRDGWVWVVLAGDGQLRPNSYEVMANFNQVTMNVCRRLEAICIDLAGSLSFDDGDFYDRVHNTPNGAKKVGRFLFEALKDRI